MTTPMTSPATTPQIEHLNLTVSDPAKTAAFLCEIFDWRIRWEGPSIHDGYTIHVGTDDRYLALYTNSRVTKGSEERYRHPGSINHIGVVVEDYGRARQRAIANGFEIYAERAYDPGCRFYFLDHDGVEWEVVTYAEVG